MMLMYGGTVRSSFPTPLNCVSNLPPTRARTPVPRTLTQRTRHRHLPRGNPQVRRRILLDHWLANQDLYARRDRDGRPPKLRGACWGRRKVSWSAGRGRGCVEGGDEEAREGCDGEGRGEEPGTAGGKHGGGRSVSQSIYRPDQEEGRVFRRATDGEVGLGELLEGRGVVMPSWFSGAASKND